MKIKKHIEDLHNINSQRKRWLFLSAFVAFSILGIIFGWDAVQSSHVGWIVISIGLMVAMAWWYWTMRIVRYLIHYKVTESELLLDLVKDIQEIKVEVIKMRPSSVDKDK
jgi:hypothetical protein